jgi:S-adenosylmethionine:tRNA ribosyltransferase-isomerase
VLISDFDFDLPPELIAQQPLADRAGSRMLHLDRKSGTFSDCAFRDFPQLLRPDDLLVFNNTRVFPARLFARRSGERSQQVSPRNPAARDFLHGTVEVLLNRQVGPWEWESLVHPGRKIGVGEKLFFYGRTGSESEGPSLIAEVIQHGTFGERRLRFSPNDNFFSVLEQIGHVPLPPYIRRSDSDADRERYQTVYARERGSAAAPTAGLHFTPEILEQVLLRGIETVEITLHVGLGTFQPLRNEEVEKNKLHRESFELTEAAASQVNRALREKRRIVAVGTTTVRTLEFCACQSSENCVEPQRGDADIFIYPGFNFRVVGAMLTNFHLPQSSLLILVSAFAGRENVLAAYHHAVAERYRFFSYGDCMFID